MLFQFAVMVGVWAGIYTLHGQARNIAAGLAHDEMKRKQAEADERIVAALKGKWQSTHGERTILEFHDRRYSLNLDGPIMEGTSYSVRDGILILRVYVTGGEIALWQLHCQLSPEALILWVNEERWEDRQFRFLVLRREPQPDEPRPFKLHFKRIGK